MESSLFLSSHCTNSPFHYYIYGLGRAAIDSANTISLSNCGIVNKEQKLNIKAIFRIRVTFNIEYRLGARLKDSVGDEDTKVLYCIYKR